MTQTPGWYPDPAAGVQRYWDGQAWTSTAPWAPPASQQVPMVTVVQQGGRGAKAVSGLSTWQNLVHLTMTVCTIGLWAPIWWLHARMSRHKVIY